MHPHSFVLSLFFHPQTSELFHCPVTVFHPPPSLLFPLFVSIHNHRSAACTRTSLPHPTNFFLNNLSLLFYLIILIPLMLSQANHPPPSRLSSQRPAFLPHHQLTPLVQVAMPGALPLVSCGTGMKPQAL